MTLRQAQDRAFGEAARALSHVAAQWLGWRPADFWAATPEELAVALGAGEAAETGPSRDEVAALMALHPDERDGADGQ